MKKTISISIAGLLFNIEEDAYQKLEGYLESVRTHFKGNTDGEEILKDIEARIAEKLSEPERKIVNMYDIEAVIASMGTVEQFDKDVEKETTSGTKRLYRDPDTAVIGGVSSGLGHYFGIDPVVIRGIFLVSLLFGGAGLLIYLVLWIVVPEAKTTSQKLEMRGENVTLSAVSDMLKEKVKDVKAPRKILRGFGLFMQKIIFPIIRIFFGIILVLIGFVSAIGVTIGIGAVFFGGILAPLGTIVAITAISAFIVALIPLVILFFLGTSLMQKKNHLGGKTGLSFFILWSIALVVLGITAARTAPEIRTIVESRTSSEKIEKEVPLELFNSIIASNGTSITYEEGEEYTVTLSGRKDDVDNTTLEIREESLSIGYDRDCYIFCIRRPVHVLITTPSLSHVELRNASTFKGNLAGERVSIILKNASTTEVMTETPSLSVVLKNSSRISLQGNAETLDLTLQNASRYEGEDLVLNTASLLLENGSRAKLGELKTLSVTAKNGSRVSHFGDPEILKEDLQNGSGIDKNTRE